MGEKKGRERERRVERDEGKDTKEKEERNRE